MKKDEKEIKIKQVPVTPQSVDGLLCELETNLDEEFRREANKRIFVGEEW